ARAPANLARRRAAELRRSRGGRAPVGCRLSGRCAVDRGRGCKELVRAGEVAPVVPAVAGPAGAGHSAVGDVRGPRFLKTDIKAALATTARQNGFDVVGVARPDAIAQKPYFERFIAEGQHGDMDWLAATAARRTDPLVLWTDARAVIMLGMNYGPDGD